MDIHEVYEEYVEKYGKDNANYLMEAMEAWQNHYQRAVFIDLGIGIVRLLSNRLEMKLPDGVGPLNAWQAILS